ncbi:uracil-DNA glycosylase [Bartonella taylorii]|uniref:Type-4 uracil-DNA glycosylase n=2 Tax=Bartonella taylorii TaxID=33046 RepID=A0A9Q9DML5_BARTA|nr:uracil-DNA glycosylase [Bartonella taylorii]EJF92869.1 uracil-DNA glycosylase, family 4 [Bartonella taylorii 8TBB]OPB34847.1 DNA polymerase [Bartonella taylorii]USP00696.1 uracil-DNA glycosylase [Bartonella taylorii]USP02888.1 uracil-DNA glycosylase [Bartonella taylorii]
MLNQTTCSISYEELLNFYKESGVDAVLTDSPVDHFNQSASLEKKSIQTINISHNQQISPTIKSPNNPLPTPNIIQGEPSAIESAKSVNTLDELKSALLAFNGCSLKLTAKNTCFSDGTAGSPLMLIGEAPGREEDIQGIPFVGKAGRLLNKILASIGLTRNNVYITNTIPWRPPGNRTPTPREVALCRPFIERQIHLAKPRILIALGGVATQFLTGAQNGIIRSRGKWLTYEGEDNIKIPVMPTFHPAYLLRTPSQKKLTWIDFLEVKKRLDSLL